MIVLSCTNITKAYIVENIIENISFTVNDGEKIGLVGLNGAGKTTLFNILTGSLSYDEGNMFISKGKKLGYLIQNTRIESQKTIIDEVTKIFDHLILMEQDIRQLEEIISTFTESDEPDTINKYMDEYSRLNEKFEEQDGYKYKSLIRGVLKGLGFNEDEFNKQINLLSGGQKSRVMLAKLLLEKPDILFLDEPTNHLDIQAITWLEKFIKDFKGTVITISHDRYFLDNTVKRIFLLENKTLKSYLGNYSEFMHKRKIELEQLKKKYEEQEKEIERQKEIITRFKQNGRDKKVRQALSREKALKRMEKIEKPTEYNKKLKLRFTPKVKSGKEVIKVENLSKKFDNLKLFSNVNFDIYKGDRIGIIGPNGIGKSTLLKILTGFITEFTGKIIKGHYVNIGYYDQEQINLNTDNTVIDEIWDDNQKLNYYQIRTLLAQFLFLGDDIYKIINDLSGGEKGKLSMLKLMLSSSNFLLMDEPTNHLDIDSKEVLEESLQNYDGTILVISHDRYFLNKVANKIYEMSTEGLFEYQGNYDYYLEKKAELEESDDENIAQKTKTKIKAEKKKERELLIEKRKKIKQLERIESLIDENERKIVEFEERLCKEETYLDRNLVVEIQDKIKKTTILLEKLYEDWTTLQQ